MDKEDVPTPDLPKKLVCTSQDQKVEPENLRESAFHEKVVRHPSSLAHTTNIGAETEIVHIGRKSHNECTVITMIGNRSQKASWDSLYSHCNIYYRLVTVDDNIVSSGVFNIVMTNKSNRYIKLYNNQTMGMLSSCEDSQICMLHEIMAFD